MKMAAKILAILGFIALAGCSDILNDGDGGKYHRPKILRVPAEFPDIMAAVDSALAGDTILVAPGTYTGGGNFNIDFSGKSIVLKSENGPEETIIDCEGTLTEFRPGLIFRDQEHGAVVDGFTIYRATSNLGGAVFCQNASPTIKNSIITNCYASTSGGAVRCKGSNTSPDFINCTFVENSSVSGGVVFAIAGASPEFFNCLIAFTSQGETVNIADASSSVQLTCCNIYGGEQDNWGPDIAEQAGQKGNLNADPLFCDRANRDFRLRPESPCLPESNTCGELIGALGEGCD